MIVLKILAVWLIVAILVSILWARAVPRDPTEGTEP